MAQLFASVTYRFNAPAAKVYSILADYRNHHPHILPPKYFAGLKVLEGGRGAGTIFRATMRVLGKKTDFRMLVTEPQPGRMLAEIDLDNELITTFTVRPKGENRTEVEISTRWTGKRGLAGVMERLFIPALLERIYRQELYQLEKYATGLDLATQTQTDTVHPVFSQRKAAEQPAFPA